MRLATRFAAADASRLPASAPSFAPFQTDSSEPADDRATRFQAFADAIRDDLAPLGILETLLTDRVILAAWRLRDDSARDAHVARSGGELPEITVAALRAERSLETAADALDLARNLRPYRWEEAAPTESKSSTPPPRLEDVEDAPAFDDAMYFSNEWTALPPDAYEFDDVEQDAFDFDDEDVDDVHEAADDQTDRLAFDYNVSDASPVVKGTSITAEYVVSLIIDGYLWSDVLAAHPELTEDDVRACLAYVVSQDEQGL